MIKILKYSPIVHEKIQGKVDVSCSIRGEEIIFRHLIFWNIKGKKYVTFKNEAIEENGKKIYEADVQYNNPDINKAFLESVKNEIENFLQKDNTRIHT